jgi:hypothetical protein
LIFTIHWRYTNGDLYSEATGKKKKKKTKFTTSSSPGMQEDVLRLHLVPLNSEARAADRKGEHGES